METYHHCIAKQPKPEIKKAVTQSGQKCFGPKCRYPHTIDHNRRRVEDKKYNKDENKSKTLGKVQTEDRRGKKKKSEEGTGRNENFFGRPAAKFLSFKIPVRRETTTAEPYTSLLDVSLQQINQNPSSQQSRLTPKPIIKWAQVGPHKRHSRSLRFSSEDRVREISPNMEPGKNSL